NIGDTSWKTGQSFQNNVGALFDDTATGTTTVTLTTTNIFPDGSLGTSLNLNAPMVFPGIIVSNSTKNYTITGGGKISGMTRIYKTGPGTLTMLCSNDFIGNVIIDNGTVVVSNFSNLGNIVAFGTPGGGQMKNDLILDGGSVNYVGFTNVNLVNWTVFNPGGA